MRHADGTYRWVFSRGVAVRDRDGKATRVAGSMTDITHRKAAEERLRHDARHDSLTGLPNRTMFLDHLELSLSRAKRDPRYRCAVLFLDLNRFKRVNDAFSHAVGDQLLVALAQRLRGVDARRVTRSPGSGATSSPSCCTTSPRWRPRSRSPSGSRRPSAEPFSTEGRDLIVTASIGIAASEPGSEAAELMRNADIAMYEAKVGSDDDTAVFTASMRRRVVGQLQLEAELRETIEKQRLRVFYQPIVEIENGRLAGLEALARWPAEADRQVSPIEFIPVAEDTGLIRPLGRVVLHEACARLSDVARPRRSSPTTSP